LELPLSEFGQFFCLHRKFLVYNLVLRNLKVRYRKSIFGFLWTLIVPASMTFVYFFVFKYIAKIGDENYPILLLSGIIPWTFFSTNLATGADSLVNNFPILSKVPISGTAFPLAETCSAFINLVLSLPVLIIAAVSFGVHPGWSWIAIPVILGFLFLQAYSFSVLLAISNVYLRDVRHLVSIGVQIWMYMTPILYAVNMIPEQYRAWFYLNPLFAIFDSIHKSFLLLEWPSIVDWAYMIGWTGFLLVCAFYTNLRLRFRLVERL
jgi:ABC-2 type transport system permease protein